MSDIKIVWKFYMDFPEQNVLVLYNNWVWGIRSRDLHIFCGGIL